MLQSHMAFSSILFYTSRTAPTHQKGGFPTLALSTYLRHKFGIVMYSPPEHSSPEINSEVYRGVAETERTKSSLRVIVKNVQKTRLYTI